MGFTDDVDGLRRVAVEFMGKTRDVWLRVWTAETIRFQIYNDPTDRFRTTHSWRFINPQVSAATAVQKSLHQSLDGCRSIFCASLTVAARQNTGLASNPSLHSHAPAPQPLRNP
jgi:hypothetical protein